MSWKLRAVDAAIAIALAGAVAMAALRVARYLRPSASLSAADTTTVPRWEEYGQRGVRFGPANPRVTLVEFLDFQCEFCGLAANYLEHVKATYRNDVAIVLRHAPIHTGSWDAAAAMECAVSLDVFDPVYVALYRQRDSIPRKGPAAIAAEAAKVDVDELRACMASADVQAAVTLDTAAFHRLRARGTPTFLINDLRVSGYQTAEVMDSLMALQLRRAGRGVGR